MGRVSGSATSLAPPKLISFGMGTKSCSVAGYSSYRTVGRGHYQTSLGLSRFANYSHVRIPRFCPTIFQEPTNKERTSSCSNSYHCVSSCYPAGRWHSQAASHAPCPPGSWDSVSARRNGHRPHNMLWQLYKRSARTTRCSPIPRIGYI